MKANDSGMPPKFEVTATSPRLTGAALAPADNRRSGQPSDQRP